MAQVVTSASSNGVEVANVSITNKSTDRSKVVVKDDEKLSDVSEQTPREKKVLLWTASSALLSVVSFAFSLIVSTPLAVIASLTAVFNNFIANTNERELTNVQKLEETYEKLKEEVNEMTTSNERLKQTIEKLEDTTDHLDTVTNAFQKVSKVQGLSIDQFEKQCEDQREIMINLRQNRKTNIIQTALSLIIRSDADGDYMLGDEEIQNIISRLRDVEGILVKEDLFKQKIKESGGELTALLRMAKRMMDADIPENERIFYGDFLKFNRI